MNLLNVPLINTAKKVVIGIDAKDGMVAIEGWEKTSDFTAVEFAKKMVNIGVQTIVYTDIATDGTLAGPNVNAMAEMASAVKCRYYRLGRCRQS